MQSNAKSLVQIGIALEAAGKDAEAGEAYRRALMLDSGDASTRIRLGKLYVAHGHFNEAAELFEAANCIRALRGEELLFVAQALTNSERSEQALPHLLRALDDSSVEGAASGMLGYWYQGRGRFAEATEAFEHSIRCSPQQSLAYYGWVQANRVDKKHMALVDQAKAVAQDPATSSEDGMYLQYVLGKAHADLGEFQKSIDHYDKANAAAFSINLSGKPFDRKRYAQIVDSTLSTFSTKALMRCKRSNLPPLTPIFVVGMMRSGTTLVEQILSSHARVGAAGEVEFWLDEGPQATDLEERSVNRRLLGELSNRYVAILQERAPNLPWVVDKMPQNFQMLGLIHMAFPDSPIVHIKRHAVDNCLSIYTTAYQQSPAFAHDRGSIVAAYRQYQRLVAHWRRSLPAHKFLELDYERLVTERESSIRQLVDFCGIGWDDRCLTPELNDRLVTTPSLWQVRQPMYRSAIGRWRQYEPWLGEFGELLN